jgi:hypothetical protein
MTKEEEIIYTIVEQWGNAAHSMDEKIKLLKDYAQEKAVAFAIDYTTRKMHWMKELKMAPNPEDVAADRMEERYNHFIEDQNVKNDTTGN